MGKDMIEFHNLTGWCACISQLDAIKLSVELVHGEEVIKHLVSYYKCTKCNGLIKTEES